MPEYGPVWVEFRALLMPDSSDEADEMARGLQEFVDRWDQWVQSSEVRIVEERSWQAGKEKP